MEDYVSQLEELWERFEEKYDGKRHIMPKKLGKAGKSEMMYMEVNGMVVVYMGLNDFDVDYLHRGHDRLHSEFSGKREFTSSSHEYPNKKALKLMTLGLGGVDFWCGFFSEKSFKDTMKDIFEEGDSEKSLFYIEHFKPKIRGKGKAAVFMASKSKDKIKEYVAQALKIIQEEDDR